VSGRLALAAALLLVSVRAAEAAGVQVKKSQQGLTYSVRVPDNYDRAQGGLLVVGFHGRTQSHDVMMRTLLSFDWLKDAVLVSVDAPADKVWQAKDLAPVSALLPELKREHHALRTICYGLSAGAFFSAARSRARAASRRKSGHSPSRRARR
jgi:hypothetical protein